VSIYAVNRLCRQVVHDPQLRQALAEQPRETLRTVRPALSEEEVGLLLAGDVGRLSKLGANDFLLHQLGRWGLLGLDLHTHGARMREAYANERALWGYGRERR
jgi:hypothetical protein